MNKKTDMNHEGIRTLSAIAADIDVSWPRVNFAAQPYLDAMHQLRTIEDSYYLDSARSVVSYFLANASTWRGDHAKRIKNELKLLLEGKADPKVRAWLLDGWRLVADKDEVVPHEPGDGTPLMVYAPDNNNTATYFCAVDTGECGDITIPDRVHRWLESMEEDASLFVFGSAKG